MGVCHWNQGVTCWSCAQPLRPAPCGVHPCCSSSSQAELVFCCFLLQQSCQGAWRPTTVSLLQAETWGLCEQCFELGNCVYSQTSCCSAVLGCLFQTGKLRGVFVVGFFCLFGVVCLFVCKRCCKICQTDALFPLKVIPTNAQPFHHSTCLFLVYSHSRTSQLLVPGPGRMSCPYFINWKNQDSWALIYVFFTVPHSERLLLLPAKLEKSRKKMGFPLNTTTTVASPSSLWSQAVTHWSDLIWDNTWAQPLM